MSSSLQSEAASACGWGRNRPASVLRRRLAVGKMSRHEAAKLDHRLHGRGLPDAAQVLRVGKHQGDIEHMA